MHINLRRFSHPKTMLGLGLLNILAAVNWAVELWDKYDFLEGKSGAIAATLRTLLNTEGGARAIFLVAFVLLVLALLFEVQSSEPETAASSGQATLGDAGQRELEEKTVPTVPYTRRSAADGRIVSRPSESTETLQAKAEPTKTEPNLVCAPALIYAHEEYGAFFEGHKEPNVHEEDTNTRMLVAKICNEFDPSRKVRPLSAVSAQVFYTGTDGEPIKVHRGTWLGTAAYQVDFDVNREHHLIIVGLPPTIRERPEKNYVYYFRREVARHDERFTERLGFLDGDFYSVKVRLIWETEGIVHSEYDFSLTITREPKYGIELMRTDPLSPKEIRSQLETFLREGSDLLREFPRDRQATPEDKAKVDDWEKSVVRFLGQYPDLLSTPLFLSDFPEVPVAGGAQSGNWPSLKKLSRRLATLRDFIDELRRG